MSIHQTLFFFNNSFLFATKVFIFYEWVLAYITLALMTIFAICANALESYVNVRIYLFIVNEDDKIYTLL